MKQFYICFGAVQIVLVSMLSLIGCYQKSSPSQPIIQVIPRQVSLAEANKILNAELPVPSYVPDGLNLAAIYLLEQSVRYKFALVFYPTGSIAGGAENVDNAPIRMFAFYVAAGMPGFLPPSGIDGLETCIISPGRSGYIITRNNSYQLDWQSQNLKWDLYLAANLTTPNIGSPKEELVKMARSVKPP